MPEAVPSRLVVEQALEQVLGWPGLARSSQLAKFLKHIVDARLNGDEANIKAYSIAVDVFGRPATFDPQVDPIVRVQARRLRALLDEYYLGEGASSPVRFNLPVGRYVPDFVLRPPLVDETGGAMAPFSAVSPARAPGRRRFRWGEALVLGGLAVAAVAVILLIASILQPRQARIEVPGKPAIAVAEFTALAGGDTAMANVAGLAVELVTDLQLFDDVDVTYQSSGVASSTVAPATYVLTGIAHGDGQDVEVTASLRRSSSSDAVVWSETVSVPLVALRSGIDEVSQALAEQLGSHRGPLHTEAMQWLDDNLTIVGSESDYICGLLFSRYRDSGSTADAGRARSCVNALLMQEPNSAEALAISSSLLLESVMTTLPPGVHDPEPLQQAQRLLDRARELAPTDSMVWEQYARFLASTGRGGEAAAAFASAMQLNPANLDAQAASARMLSLRGKSERGNTLAQALLQRAVDPPPWYYLAPAINALRDGDYSAAMFSADRLASGDAELAVVIDTVAAHRLNIEAVLNRSLAQLLEETRFRRFGIVPVLRQRIADAALVDDIVAELKAAGVADNVLNGGF